MTCVFFAGLRDSKCFAASASLPPIWFFPWIGSRDSTFFNASAKSRLFPSTLKSVSGSFRNSDSKTGLLRAEIYIRLRRWALGEGRRAKGEGRRAKGEGRRAK